MRIVTRHRLLVVCLTVAFLGLDAVRAAPQAPKAPITPPAVKPTALPDLDFFAPSRLPPESVKPKPVVKPAPISEEEPQAPRFVRPLDKSPLPRKSTSAPSSTTPRPVDQAPLESETGKPPQPLPPPTQRSETTKTV